MLLNLICLLSLPLAPIDDEETILELSAATGGLSVSARICIGPFIIVDHWYSLKKLYPKLHPEFAYRVHIDGRFAWGTEGTEVIEYPSREIRWIEVRFNDEVFRVPKEAYWDIFDLHDDLGTGSIDGPKSPSYWLWVSDEKQLLRLKAMGSDGTAGYRVMWTVHRNGQWSRSVWPSG